MIPVRIIQTVLFTVMALWPAENGIGGAVLALRFALKLVGATQDIATDRLTIEIIGKANLAGLIALK